VPLNATVRNVLKEYMKGIKGDWLFSGSGRDGTMTSRSSQRMFNKYKRLSGVDATPHMLRHTFGKMLIDAGESHDKVAALLGHASMNTTARYTIPSAHDLECSVEKLSWE
ncbi:MAG: tyrosine-type recombinase/integrase, partial [Desulfocucumaceae bacterium]